MKKLWQFFALIILLMQSVSPGIVVANEIAQTQENFALSDVVLNNMNDAIQATIQGEFKKSDTTETVKDIKVSENFKLEDATSQPLLSDSGEQKGTYEISNNTIHLKSNASGSYTVKLTLTGKYNAALATKDVTFDDGKQVITKTLTGLEETEPAKRAESQTTDVASQKSQPDLVANEKTFASPSKLTDVADEPQDIKNYLPDNTNGTIFDKVSLSFTDASGNPVPEDKITADTKLTFKYEWSIPNELKDGYQLKDGDYFEFNLPQNISYSPGSNTLGGYGDFQIFADGKVRFTFRNVNAGDDIKGNFTYNQASIQVDKPGSTIIDIPTKDGKDTHEIVIKPKGGNDISKSGRFDAAQNPSKIFWDVVVNTSGNLLKNAVISDPMPEGLTYDSVAIYLLTVDLNGKVTGTSKNPLIPGTDYDVDAQGTVTLKGQYANTYQAFKATYTSTINQDKKPNDGGTIPFTNTASLTNNGQTKPASNTQNAVYGKLLDKGFDGADTGGSQIFNWHIDYNAGVKQLPAGTTIVDTLNGDQKFIGTPVVTDTTGKVLDSSSYNIVISADGKTMTIAFPNGLDKQIKIAYKSQVTVPIDDNSSNLKLENTATSNGSTVTKGSGTVAQQGLVKSLADTDYDKRQVTWKFDINIGRQKMTNWSLVDTIPAGLTLDSNSFVFTNTVSKKDLTKDVDYEVTPTATGFSVKFLGDLNNSTSDSFTIKFKTNFEPNQMTGTANKWTNLGVMTWTDENGTKHQNTGKADFTPKTEYVKDGSKSGSYNAITKKITWTVVANYNQRKLVNASIVDPIVEGRTYVDDSAVLYTATINKDGSLGALVKVDGITPTYDEKNKIVNVNLPEGSTAVYVLKFDTSLDNQVIDQKTYDNKATYSNDGKSTDLTASVTVKNSGTVVTKTGEQDKSDSSYANWQIWVNQSQSTVKDVVVTDTPSINQTVIRDSIVVHGSNVNANGDVTEDASKVLVEGKDYTVDLQTDAETGKQKLIVEFSGTIDTAYIIKYKVFINSSLANDKLTNDVTLSATGQKEVKDGKTEQISVVNSGGSSQAKNINLTLNKVDQDDQKTPLAGVTIELYSYTGGKKGALLRTSTTDDKGQIKWGNLKSGDYVIVETKTITGYDIPDDLKRGRKITLSYDKVDADSNFALKVTNEKTKTSVKGTKVWNDSDNKEGFRPDSITMDLYRNDDYVTSTTATEDNKWAFSFDNLVKFDANGDAYHYTVKEKVVPNYQTEINATDLSQVVVTNSRTVEETSVSGSKTWDDADNQDGIRPNSIKVTLLANGEKLTDKTVTADDNWQYTFDHLQKYAKGQAIVYTVTEDAVSGYTSKVTGFDITNSHTPDKTTAQVKKVWDDADNQDGIRPTNIKVQLYGNGTAVGEAIELNADNNWQATFSNLDTRAKGVAITYSVKEVDQVPGYTTSIDNTDKDNLVITNHHTPEQIEVKGSKTWDDVNNQDGIRPEAITVQLFADDKALDTKTVTAQDNWQYSFGSLPKYAAGKAIVYTVKEDAVDKYVTSYDGLDITNSYKPAVRDLTVTKKWSDYDNQYKTRTDKVQVQLYADGVALGKPVDVTAGNQWQYTWQDLSVNKAGKAIVYTVKEVTQLSDYEAKVTISDKDHLVITNTLTKIPKSPEQSKLLPQTSDASQSYYLLIGLAMVGLASLVLFRKKNRLK